MKRSKWFVFGVLLAAAAGVVAQQAMTIWGKDTATGKLWPYYVNQAGQMVVALLSGEDQTNGVLKTEQRFSYCVDDADLVCNAAPGFLHAINCWAEDAAAEAGRVDVRNSTAASSGDIVWGHQIPAAAFSPISVILDIEMTVGVTLDFTTTTDVFCTLSYRDNG